MGAPYFDAAAVDDGQVLVFHGSASGLPATPSWVDPGNIQAGLHWGWSVSAAGDVNADGYADLLSTTPDYAVPGASGL